MLRTVLAAARVAALSLAALPAAAAPYPSNAPPAARDPARMTCAQAIDFGQRQPERMFESLVDLVYRSLEQRHFAFPPSRVAGEMLGQMINDACQRSPQTLLARAVDNSVREAIGD